MSLPLKPLSIDSNFKRLDSKQSKYHQNVQKALQHFDAVTEWADYISSLGKLLKALQSWTPQFQNVKYYVPFPYQVSRRLASSLSPDLPSGVHLKTLDVYIFIFEKIGMEALSKECNIWVAGILPLMAYASISVKSPVIELYEKYLIRLPPSMLRLLAKPLIASLLPGVDDESSEFQPMVLGLLDDLRRNLGDDSLFWQSCFMIMLSLRNRRLGGLVWMTKRLPSLNAVPHLVSQYQQQAAEGNGDVQDKKQQRQAALALLLPESRCIVSPEPGLLIRSLVNSLREENELLIQRGILDLLAQRIHLHSPVLQTLVTKADRELLIMSCCKTMLKKDMSLNRRIWNWLLGPSSRVQQADTPLNDYFPKYGLESLMNGIIAMIGSESELPNAFKICLALMDRWEIGSRIVPHLFIKLMKAADKFKESKHVITVASMFFDSIETTVIWGSCYEAITQKHDYDLLEFLLSTFNVATDEEIVVRHCPLILLTMLLLSFEDEPAITKQKYRLCNALADIIPDKAYLPLSLSALVGEEGKSSVELLSAITNFYIAEANPLVPNSADKMPPFPPADLAFLITEKVYLLLLKSLETGCMVNEMSHLYVSLIGKIPTQPDAEDKATEADQALVSQIFSLGQKLDEDNSKDSIFGIVVLYSDYLAHQVDLIDSLKILKMIVDCLWHYLLDPNRQMEAIRCLLALNRGISKQHIEGALTSAFIREKDIAAKLTVLDALWTKLENDIGMIRRPLQLMFDELFDEQHLSYLHVSKWIVSVINANASNRLFQVLADNLLSFDFLMKETLTELDDLDLFTYHVQTVTNVLRTEQSVLLKSFSLELTSLHSFEQWREEDVSTYKGLTIGILLRFLNLENNTHGRSIRSALILLDTLIDGTEQNFKAIVTSLLQLSTKYIKIKVPESELIIVSLLSIVSKILSLSHKNDIKLDIFDDNSSHINYIDFLVSSIANIESPLTVSSYVQLLSESIIYFQHSIFNIILPLSSSLTQCIERLFYQSEDKGKNYKSFSLLIDGLEELLEVSHGYLMAGENNGYLNGPNSKNDFLQSMVSNVFSNDPSNSTSKLQGEREVVFQSYKRAIDCSFGIWIWAQNISNSRALPPDHCVGDPEYSESAHQLSYKYKFKTKKLIDKLFTLEPLEILENLISYRMDDLTITLTHVLDGNRPVLTLPHLMLSVVSKCNKATTVTFSSIASRKSSDHLVTAAKLEPKQVLAFIIEYVRSLENAAIEDFYNDFLVFIKEVSQNYSQYEQLSYQLLILIAIISEKIAHSQFGQQKRVRKEVSDVFVKYLTSTLAEDIVAKNGVCEANYQDILFILARLQYIVNESPQGDRFGACVSTIVSHCVSPLLKQGKLEVSSPGFMELLLAIAPVGAKVRNWKTLLNDIFTDNTKLSMCLKEDRWNQVIYEWSQYPDNQDKLISDLLLAIGQKGNVITPTINPFQGWAESEVDLKCKQMVKLAYLLLIAPPDTYLLYFKQLMSQLEDYLFSTDTPLKANCFILLRAVFLCIEQMHIADYWSMISHGLQTGLQAFYESLQIQEPIDAHLVLHMCKCLDLLLVLNIEDFSATNEWLFIIDTINCIYKTDPFMALIDEISECKDYTGSHIADIELAAGDARLPLLCGIRRVDSHLALRTFFHNLSYSHYETSYSLKPIDQAACCRDVAADILAAISTTN
ncbi:AGL187Wp [Eremothecium gossypii ATCC 10895]|uniref:AGL187Wp n=1 Tax=Eremothecium gossypii (strain ATCC 10895 / CBS 109.51 / FGSC 9923 / NRRL Y-1056) TaxID=284811 RepID=Q750X6_EREGS|nr:AGL187Wp [Eremothecium gossypii ATCC 10895]AAS54304.2 AGL187Wp [Eremothecium gossypii ATCC 10895]AEY98630.1 FAGL187Wp [Eremothecium gossypii FDAG1]